jgi:hypothetical protein
LGFLFEPYRHVRREKGGRKEKDRREEGGQREGGGMRDRGERGGEEEEEEEAREERRGGGRGVTKWLIGSPSIWTVRSLKGRYNIFG